MQILASDLYTTASNSVFSAKYFLILNSKTARLFHFNITYGSGVYAIQVSWKYVFLQSF